jgi:MFS transporter, DHA1 family, solute carrier family 18 (vesicular amine transporter), member 1/2
MPMETEVGAAHGAEVAPMPKGAAAFAAITEVFLIDIALIQARPGVTPRLPSLPAGEGVAQQSEPQIADLPLAPARAVGAASAVGAGVRRRGAAQVVLLAAFALDLLLYGLVVPFLPGHAQALGASQAVTGALFASYAVGTLVATPPAAWLTDRLDARRTLLAGLLAMLAATLLFAYAPGLPALFAARTAQGISSAVTWTAGLALVAQLYEPRERLAVFSGIFIASGIGILIGPPVGGVLYAWGGFRAPFLVGALLVGLDGLGRLIFLPGRAAMKPTPAANDSNGSLLRSGRFLLALVVTLVGAAVLALLEPTLPPLLAASFGLSPLLIGLLIGAMILVYMAALPLATLATHRLSAQVTIVFGLFFGALALVLLASSSSVGHVAFALAAVGLAAACTLGPTLELLTAVGEAEHAGSNTAVPYGAIYGAYNVAYAGGILVGPLAAGLATGALGSARGIALPAVLPLLMGFVMLGGARQAYRHAGGKHE